MNNASPQANAPITAASITTAVGAVLVAFTALTAAQTAAILGIVGIAAAAAVQRWFTDPKGTP